MEHCVPPSPPSFIHRMMLPLALYRPGVISAYKLHVHTCNWDYADSSDPITFSFCSGGDFCLVTEVVQSTAFDVINQDVEVLVSLGYVPTTMVITNSGTNML